MSSTPPPPISPGGPATTREEKDARPGGVLKWGLVGCAGLSVLLIVGMVKRSKSNRPAISRRAGLVSSTNTYCAP